MTDIALPRATAVGRELIDNTNLLVNGMKRSGKTTWSEEVLTAKKKRLIIVDTRLHDYTHGEIFTDINKFADSIAEKAVNGEFRYIVRCPHQEHKVFSLFETKGAQSLVQNCTMLVEEISEFTDSHNIDPALLDHYQYGGHNRNNLIGVARFPFEIHRTVTRLTDIIVSFRQEEGSDIKYFSQFREKDESERLRRLERGYYLVMKGTEKELFEFIDQP